MREALQQAREGPLHPGKMLQVLPTSRSESPPMLPVNHDEIPVAKITDVIGPGGK